MKNLWEKIKALLSRAWNGLTLIGRIILGLIIVALVILASFALAKDIDEDKHNEDVPEIAQVYEPSIGTPLPADNPGTVGGATTTESSTPQNVMTTNYVAPHAGVDPNEPVDYKNDDLKFAAKLPVGSDVTEETSRITFTSQKKALQYIVSVNNSTETLQDIKAQLQNSPSAKNISDATFNNNSALKFTANGYGSGIVFVSNGKVYYLLGNSIYFSTFKLL